MVTCLDERFIVMRHCSWSRELPRDFSHFKSRNIVCVQIIELRIGKPETCVFCIALLFFVEWMASGIKTGGTKSENLWRSQIQ